MNISIFDFCAKFDIKWQPINLRVDTTTNKKTLLKCFCCDDFSYMPQPNDFTRNQISNDELIKRQSYIDKFEYIAIDTTKFYHIDVDDGEYVDKVSDLMKTCPYFLSSTKKLPHIIFESNNKYDKMKCETNFKFNKNGIFFNPIELLSGQWSYVKKNEIVINCSDTIPKLSLDFISCNKYKVVENNNKVTIESDNEYDSDDSALIYDDKPKIKTIRPQKYKHEQKTIDDKKYEPVNNCFKLEHKIITNDEVQFDNEKYELVKNIQNCYKLWRLDGYDDWINLLFAYKNEFGDRGYQLFDEVSKKSKKHEPIENREIWDRTYIRTSGNRKNLYHLIKWARDDDENKFNLLTEKNTYSSFSICEKDIAKYVIDKFMKKNFVCTNVKNSQFYFFNGVRWIEDLNNIRIYKIITEDLVDDYEQKKISFNDNKILQSIDKVINKLKGKINYCFGIIDHISRIVFDCEFLMKLDENPDLLGFNDGILDLSTGKFRNGKPDDFLSKNVGYNYPMEYTDYKKEIDLFLSRVFPDENIRNFVLQHQAQALCGRKGVDTIFTHTGIGGNGKSVEIEILKFVFGEYYVNIPINMLTSQNNYGHNTPDPFIGMLKGIRYASANEPKDGETINDSMIKMIGSQEEQSYRLLFSNDIVKLFIQLKLHIYCNDKLKIKGECEAIARRMKVIPYFSRFTEKLADINELNNIYWADPTLFDKVKNWKNDYMKMLIELYNKDYVFNCPLSKFT